MKIKRLCPCCMPKTNYFYLNYEEIGTVELENNYFYEFECSNGHKNSFFLQNPRYELLFDFGISAYLDGYYREAVLDFAACLDRFYEFCIFTLLGFKMETEAATVLWKEMKMQSERQYGAFLALFFSKSGELPELPVRSKIELRNNVTHKGYFPTKKETEEYAQYVANQIIKISEKLPDDFEAHVAGLYPVMEELKKKTVECGGHNIITVLSLLKAGKTFEEALFEFKKYFGMFYAK